MQRNFVAEVYRKNITFIRKIAKWCFWATVKLWDSSMRFILSSLESSWSTSYINEHFSLAQKADDRHYRRKYVEIDLRWRGWVTLGLNIRLNGYVYCQYLYTIRLGMVLLQLYRSAPDVFTQKKLCSRLYSLELEFYSQKRQIRFLSHPLGSYG